LYSALPGLEIIESVGVAAIAAESKRRTQKMVDSVLERGWTLNSPREAELRGGSVMIGVDDGPAMVDRLASRKVFVDCRPQAGLRVSPHFFNTDEEVDEALDVLSELM
jgi:kynureninase